MFDFFCFSNSQTKTNQIVQTPLLFQKNKTNMFIFGVLEIKKFLFTKVRMTKGFSVIVACTLQNGIGDANNNIPWQIKEDMAFFRTQTMNSVVIMGRNTYNSLPPSQRPLKNRVNVVISKSPITQSKEVVVMPSLNAALKWSDSEHGSKQVFIIGGARLYHAAFNHYRCTTIFMTRVLDSIPCTVIMPGFDAKLFELQASGPVQVSVSKGNLHFQMLQFQRKPEESQYQNLVRDVVQLGFAQTNTMSLCLLNCSMNFSLRDNQLPVFTSTISSDFSSVVFELLSLLQNQSTAMEQPTKRIKASKSTDEVDNSAETQNFAYHQHGQAFRLENIKLLIANLRASRNSRQRLVINEDIFSSCSVMMQFCVSELENELSCILYSEAENVTMIPANVTFYALLTCLIAVICKLKPGDLWYHIGEAHIFNKDVDALATYVSLPVHTFPMLKMNIPQVGEMEDCVDMHTFVDSLKVDQFQLIEANVVTSE